MAVAVLALAGCGRSGDRASVRSVAESFYAAAGAHDGARACTYVGSSDFWSRTLQNWQSEFLAVGSMAILSVYLRQRGSPESKPVGAPHDATGVEG